MVQALWKDPGLRRKLIVTLGILVIFRVMAYIPVLRIDPARMNDLLAGNLLVGTLDLFAGGGTLANFSIVAAGLVPFTVASALVRMLMLFLPALDDLRRQGAAGQETLERYVQWLAIPVALLYAWGISTLFNRQIGLFPGGVRLFTRGTVLRTVHMLCMLTLGSVATTYLAFLIDRDGIGRGTHVIWLGGLSVVLGQRIVGMALDRSAWLHPGIAAPALLLALLVAVGGMVYLGEARHRVRVLYPRRARAPSSPGRRAVGGSSTYIPLRVIPAGIQPVVATQGLLALIGLVGGLIASASAAGWTNSLGTWIVARVDPLGPVYWILLFAGIVFYSMAYVEVWFEETDMAGNLQKVGGAIPTIRPGRATHDHLRRITLRITLGGSLIVALMMVVLPNLVYWATGEDGFYLILALMLVAPAVIDLIEVLRGQLSLSGYAYRGLLG